SGTYRTMECLSSKILPFGNILPHASLFAYNVTEREHRWPRKLPMTIGTRLASAQALSLCLPCCSVIKIF
ncbi:MAG: hypothetical protein JW920_12300, partial [Deltaproteobacteria bacterium]|nr:hypothetical protein [Deltaproteobacteria bacterium]